MQHAFDNSGRLYDGEGFLNSWWTDATSAAFEDKSQCFIKQYGNFSVQGPDTTYPVNGKMTLGENLADNGGVRAAYDAMTKDDMGLPGLENFTAEQLFFINYGRVWCTKMRPEMSVQRVRTDVHSPANVRVNGAVQNSVEFAKAFQCKEKQAMNPSDKCQIWQNNKMPRFFFLNKKQVTHRYLHTHISPFHFINKFFYLLRGGGVS